VQLNQLNKPKKPNKLYELNELLRAFVIAWQSRGPGGAR
jgi:hypothetical protein